jgi:hypothetical protein
MNFDCAGDLKRTDHSRQLHLNRPRASQWLGRYADRRLLTLLFCVFEIVLLFPDLPSLLQRTHAAEVTLLRC